jgi:hypothetical protein
MSRFVWILAWTAVAIWSLLAWGAYGLLDVFGDVAVRNADVITGDPEIVEFLAWVLATLRSLGLGAVVVVWGLISLLILGTAAILSRLFGRSAPPAAPDWQRTVRTGPDLEPRPPTGRNGGPPSAVRDVMRRLDDRR